MDGWGLEAGAQWQRLGQGQGRFFGRGQSQLTYLTYNSISENNEDEKRKKIWENKG